MWHALRRLALGIFLIAAASAVLLLSDLPRRSPQDARTPAATTGEPSSGATPLPRLLNVAIVEYNTMKEAEESEGGIREGLRRSGLVEGRDYELSVRNAQGDMATLPMLVDAAVASGADLIMPLSTPTLQATIQRVKDRPVVFTLIANPIVAGAGSSFSDHRPNVTGIATASAYREVVELVREMIPGARRIGTLYVPSEANSVYNHEQVQKEAKALGLEMESIAVSTSSEVADAALALASRDIDAVCQIAGNLTTTSFSAIRRAADRYGLPTFGFLGSNATEGAVAVLSRDYYDGGLEAAALAARVMRGESPAGIPIQPLLTTRLLLNPEAARRVGLTIPKAVRERAFSIIGEQP